MSSDKPDKTGSYNKTLGYRPNPPPLPQIDPDDPAPRWDWSRVRYNLPVDKGPKPWPKVGDQPASPDDPDWRGVVRNNVIELPLPEPEELGKPIPPRYMWFDTPDWADPFKKMGSAARFFFLTGGVVASACGAWQGHPFTLPKILMLTRKYMVPTFLAGMLGAGTVITVANLRGKADDMYNYTAGGFVITCIAGRKNYRDFVQGFCTIIPAGLLLKYCAEENIMLIPRWNFRRLTHSIGGQSGDDGFRSGDLRFGLRSNWGDPGRDVRKPYG